MIVYIVRVIICRSEKYCTNDIRLLLILITALRLRDRIEIKQYYQDTR